MSAAVIAADDAPARAAKTQTTVVRVPGPAQGEVSVGFVALRSTRGDRAKPPKLQIANAKSLPANVTIYAGTGRARKTAGTYLAPYIIVNRYTTSARSTVRSAQAGTPFAVGMGFVHFHRALKGQVFNANNILQSNTPVQQTFLNLCKASKGDCQAAYGKLKNAPGCHPKPEPGPFPDLFAAQVCAAPSQGGTQVGITTTVGPPTVSGGGP